MSEKLASLVLERRRHLVAEPVESVAKWRAPLLIPPERGARAAAAVGAPACDAVWAAPRRVLVNLDLVSRWEVFEKLPVVRELREVILLDVVERVGERHVALRMMMPVGLAVRRDVNQLRPLACCGERADEAIGEVLALVKQPLEGDAARDRTVVEEERERASRGKCHAVRHRRIDLRTADVGPHLLADRSHSLRLVRREHGEENFVLGEEVERVEIDRRFGKPHPFRLPAEAVLEVANPPENLRLLVAPVGERHEHVVVRLRHRGSVAGEARTTGCVCRENVGIRVWRFPLQPRQKRRTEVEADSRVIVLDFHDAVGVVEDSRRRVRRVALGSDPLVPVVIRGRGILKLELLEPGVLARWLVEVSVDADVSVHGEGDVTASHWRIRAPRERGP